MTVGVDERLSVVANVLFPTIGNPGNRADLYRRHAELLRRARRRRKLHSSWGSTYFERLLDFNGSGNQLDGAIRAFNQWRNHPKAAVVMHLSCPTSDSLRPRGSPCLQYLQLLYSESNALDLVAVYRNHDFLKKAFGNFIGLGRILRFLSRETGIQSGRIVCHSCRAYVDTVGKLRELIDR